MAPVTYKVKLTRPQVFLWRMSLFLILAILLAIILDGQTQQLRHSFMANPGLNALIIGVLVVGIVYAFRQVLRLYPEINWVNNFRISDPGITSDKTTPTLLAPMATMLKDRTGHLSLATGAMRSLLDSVASRLDEQRETTRYLVGLLVFLGLLGTFWGLLQTVSSVGATIGALDTNAGESVMLFDQLKEGLAGPLKGMGTAFSCSMFGLAGSLILGFLDLQAGHAQGRFYNELEDWLSGITELQLADAPGAGAGAGVAPQVRYALLDMQRSLADLNDKVEHKMLTDNTGEAVKDLAAGVDKLIRQMRAEQKVVREWADEQAQQQHELATVLRQITDKAKIPVREERK
ncbi:MAG: flagellar motor protein MotA [Methyloceanibacter sp.]